VSWFRSSRRQPSPGVEPPPSGREAGAAAPDAPEAVETVARPSRSELEGKPLADLHELAARAGVERYRLLRRERLIGELSGDHGPAPAAETQAAPVAVAEVRDAPAEGIEDLEGELRTGVLDLVADGYGFVRVAGLVRSDGDAYVPRTLVRRYGLRKGEEVSGLVRTRRSERQPRLVSVETVEGRPASERRDPGPSLDDLPVQRPSRSLPVGGAEDAAAGRMLDIVAPLGKGQRGLIAGPPGAGATTLLQQLASGVAGSGAHVSVALVDVRPEEVPEWEALGVEVAAAAVDSSPRDHVAVAELALERAKRVAERGEDAVLLLDSITRLARAYGLARGRAGKDAPEPELAAVEGAKRWFAAARDAGEGSLTVVVVARVESESSLEGLVYEGLVDSANMIVRLDSELAARGLHPAIDARRSRTLGEEALVGEERLRKLESMRGVMRSLDPPEAWEFMAQQADIQRDGD
jgi:transcription termination factor Rho